MLRRAMIAVFILSGALGCSGPDHGPYWEHQKVTPSFSVMTDNFSTTFEGHVFPDKVFVLGPEDGVSFTTANVRLTVNAAAVWAYAPIYVELYDGEESDVGKPEARIARFVVDEPALDGSIQFQESLPLERPPRWVRVEFADFSGQCVLQLLGHH